MFQFTLTSFLKSESLEHQLYCNMFTQYGNLSYPYQAKCALLEVDS